jgi:hypothetical protein
VCGFVFTLGGGQNVLQKKKTAKKEACRLRVLVVDGGQAAYAVRQVKRMCDRCFPPLFTLSSW